MAHTNSSNLATLLVVSLLSRRPGVAGDAVVDGSAVDSVLRGASLVLTASFAMAEAFAITPSAIDLNFDTAPEASLTWDDSCDASTATKSDDISSSCTSDSSVKTSPCAQAKTPDPALQEDAVDAGEAPLVSIYPAVDADDVRRMWTRRARLSGLPARRKSNAMRHRMFRIQEEEHDDEPTPALRVCDSLSSLSSAGSSFGSRFSSDSIGSYAARGRRVETRRNAEWTVFE